MEIKRVKEAIDYLVSTGNDGFPLGDGFRSRDYSFSSEAISLIERSGFTLKWLDTFKGGCWHIVLPSRN